ncbi:hypothetical protein ABB37_06499 [Leptomonas pyrrhocoris]|uniref:Uncharacterized protein n=1 Tax=Leptomonas pyrrhocoris TaxID=157538 RepID=A0A0M9FYB9_LEPPY|nr:hypothetical protein ABB37_06499 [Leptomonas pyrrhocoris]XP_015656825.1 hypothetical protein ABB37_06499 [Leptomonas pyrrhocoris]KPA78385.1 hypothetical protein ABB37_06499 [Leptomonas pyrrhocoris]KPA78386.1 hypothetical protein ABB37_06499 [Leptomonas pyrrhocoris]|eukprot:XP_015656824.1 hypothetical protein ABB37_06499 [Leptomonas pyrrhocoris]
MPGTSSSAFDVPPLPRFRYHRKSGTWRKEKVPPTNASAGTSPTDARPCDGDITAAGAATQTTHEPFESSYDYFLRSVRPPPPKWTQAERDAHRREATRGPIRDFEAALFKNQSYAVSGRRLRSAGEMHERGGTATRRARKSLDSMHSITMTTSLHPLIGYASTASMPAVYAAIATLKPHPLNFASTLSLDDRLERSEFHEFLSAIGPIEVLSPSYEDTMFRTLPSYAADTETAEVLAVLTLLLDHRYHPQFESNITAIFRSFDVDEKGVVALEALHPQVILAWAETRTFGKLREQWSSFSAVVANEVNSGAATFLHLPTLMPRNAVRAFLTCTEALYAAACSLDLDGGSL